MINQLITKMIPFMPKKLVWIFSRKYIAGDEIGFGEWGDSKHFVKRTSSSKVDWPFYVKMGDKVRGDKEKGDKEGGDKESRDKQRGDSF